MPSQSPATFASAAASNGAGDSSSSIRGGGNGSEWSRSRPNGATQTFRRTSQATNNSSLRDSTAQPAATATSNLYVPPHVSAGLQQSAARSGNSGDHRYTKEQLLDVFKAIGGRGADPDVILTEGWQPGAAVPTSNGAWSRRDDGKDNGAGPDVCWDVAGGVQPLSLTDMTEDERLLFSSSVNSPLKPPPQSAGKDSAQTPGANGRKSSISQTPGSGSVSASGARPGARRRDTSDAGSSISNLASPTAFRSAKEDSHLVTPPPSLLRRRTDFKDSVTGPSFGERARLDTSLESSSPFGSFKRSGPMSASINGPSSPWAASGSQSAGFGSFGSFALDSSAAPGTPGDKKPGFGSARGESRFKGLMSKESSEDVGKTKDRQGLSLLEKLGETEHDGETTSQWPHARRTMAQDSGSILDELDPRGSAVLAGDDAESYDQLRTHEQIGFSALGQSGEAPFRSMLGARNEARPQETPHGHHQVGGAFREPMSPTSTNPYQSPEGDKAHDGNDTDDDRHSNPYSNRPSSKPFGLDAGDRSQTSSAGASRFSNLGGLGGLGGLGAVGGWSGAASGPLGGPARAIGGGAFNSPFQDPLFSDMTPSASGGIFGGQQTAAYGAIGRGSKLGSLFPGAQQDQFRDPQGFDGFGPGRGMPGSGFGIPPRDNSSPGRQGHGVLDDLFGTAEAQARGAAASSPFALHEGQGPAIQNPQQSAQPSIAAPIGSSVSSPPNPNSQDAATNQMPTAQQKTMVMPDRMRWIYRDPQGNTQGPWSGLEMHDWYKAGFFSPELLVKKQEDGDYEPLAQLIRRIGNSREPFLVPQIGIPHGPPTSQPGAPGAMINTTAGPAGQAGVAQPPFPGNFPSFGTTLTADQQNALERRKQEEQYLMARQKEHLVHHQSWMRQFQPQAPPSQGMMAQGLHHHSSAHSLQSQPSYGSITSPGGYQPSGPVPIQQQQQQPGMPGFFDRSGQQLGAFGSNAGSNRTDLASSLDRLSMDGARPPSFGSGVMPHGSQDLSHQQQVGAMLQDRARLQREQEQMGGHGQITEQESNDRLAEYHQLRAQEEQEQGQASETETADAEFNFRHENQSGDIGEMEQSAPSDDTLAVVAPDPSSAQPIMAPAPSISPLPAPAAQRSKHPVIDTIASETRSRSHTPVETPTTATLAPWAKDTSDGPKGPSLKEIQEAEARKAAQQEELAAAARRAALAEQERALAAQAQAQNVAGLPSGANWAASASPTGVGSPAWSKKAAVTTSTATGPKKTLSQIQKEEEARKNRAAAAAAAAAGTAVSPGPGSAASGAGGKRYAELASKVAPPGGVQPTGGSGGAWTTVGAGGKAKGALAPAVSAVPQRSASGPVPTVQAMKPAATRTTPVAPSKQTAHDELVRWAKNALAKGMPSHINVDEFVRNILMFPLEPEIISDSVYASSDTLDGHRFADEYIRRRKLADKGQVAPDNAGSFVVAGGAQVDSGKNSSPSGAGAGGGWSEVARKGEKASEKASKDRDESQHAFKMVAPKKKGKR